jgi:hypothetical protein
MKLKVCLLLLLVLLSACKKSGGGGSAYSPPDVMPPDDVPNEPKPEPDPVYYPFDFDQETAGGIQIESRGHAPLDLVAIDLWYEEAQQCVADWFAVLYPDKDFEFFDAPPVIIEDDLQELCADVPGLNGIYCTDFAIPFVGLNGVTYQFENYWKHEFIHHVLFMNEFSSQKNLNHKPDEIWSNCTS